MRRTGQGQFTAHRPGYQVWCFLFLLQGWFINITFFCSRENGQWKVGKRPPCHEDATGAVLPCPPPIPRWQHPTPQLEWPPRRSSCPACDTPTMTATAHLWRRSPSTTAPCVLSPIREGKASNLGVGCPQECLSPSRLKTFARS